MAVNRGVLSQLLITLPLLCVVSVAQADVIEELHREASEAIESTKQKATELADEAAGLATEIANDAANTAQEMVDDAKSRGVELLEKLEREDEGATEEAESHLKQA